MPKSNKERQADLKTRRKAAGLERVEYWVTGKERKALDKLLADMRVIK